MRDIVPKTNSDVQTNKSNEMNKFQYKSVNPLTGRALNGQGNPTPPQMLSNPEACTITRIATSEPETTIDRNDPMVKRMVYSTLRNYLGAYNNQANQLATKYRNIVKDKGVQDQIEKITATGNLPHLNGRINPKETNE